MPALHRRLALAFGVALCLAACELPDEPLTPTTDVIADAADADVTPTDAAAARDAGPAVPCTALVGQWSIAACGLTAMPANFAVDGCQFQVISPAPELHGGAGLLRPDNVLLLVFPGSNLAGVECQADMALTSFQGTCRVATGTCPIVGVKTF